jgi:hypothetical protein
MPCLLMAAVTELLGRCGCFDIGGYTGPSEHFPLTFGPAPGQREQGKMQFSDTSSYEHSHAAAGCSLCLPAVNGAKADGIAANAQPKHSSSSQASQQPARRQEHCEQTA